MRGTAALFTVAVMLGGGALLRLKHNAPNPNVAPVTLASSSKPYFETHVKPIFQARCQPCHVQSGQVYNKMPFDKAETIARLGTKLFTRIKDEKERRVIEEFLDTSKKQSK